MTNNNLLNTQTGLDFRIKRIGYHEAIIENATNTSLEQLYNDLYGSNEEIADFRLQVLNLIGDRNINPERDERNKQIRIRLSEFHQRCKIWKAGIYINLNNS